MDGVLSQTLGYLVVAIIVAIAARRIQLPYTVGLVAAGIALAFGEPSGQDYFTQDFIFGILLPPLLFEGALNLDWRELRKDALPILTLSILGTIISTVLVALGMTLALGWPLLIALVFGSIIAATDPVAVIALFKDLGIRDRTRLLVESESLFNDGVAAVLFVAMLGLAHGAPGIAADRMIAITALSVGGGIVAGLLCAGAALLLAGRSQDPLVETALTTVAAYGSFLVAEHFHLSGVLATVAAGLLMGNLGTLRRRPLLSEKGREFVQGFWEFAAFIANSLIFLAIGFSVGALGLDLHNAAAIALSVLVVMIARALAVYPLCALFARTSWRIERRVQHVLWWGGLRGALALVLTLSLPRDLVMHDDIVIAAFGVVVFSVIIQGLTIRPLMSALDLTKPGSDFA